MNQLGLPVLSGLIFWPVLGGVLVLLAGHRRAGFVRGWTLLVALVELGLAAVVVAAFRPEEGGLQFVERTPWVPALGLEYFLGVDGLSLWLVALSALLLVVAVLAAWPLSVEQPAGYAAFLLFLQAGVTGALVALDLGLFFFFWEAMLIPMYLLIGMYGGPRRLYAALKFFLYTTVGSLGMLVAILVLYVLHSGQTGRRTFDLLALAQTRLPSDLAVWLFVLFALAFAIKVPLFPLHTWLPDTYSQAPLAVLALATMLVKVGAYGFLRIALPLFPVVGTAWAGVIGLLALVGILYGGLAAIAQRDLVRLLAYASLSHLGFIVLGAFALNLQGVQGSLLQMVNHGLSAGALFVLASFLLARTGTLDLTALGGLAARWPVLAGFFLLSMLSAAGLPGLNGFVGEVLILLGAYQRYPVYAVLATSGVVLAAIYLFRMFRQVMHGPAPALAGPDLRGREVLALLPLAVLILWIGLFPATFLAPTEATVQQWLGRLTVASAATAPETVVSLLPVER